MHVGEVAVARSRRAEGGSERRGGSVMRAGAHTTLAVVMMLACQAVTRVAGQDSRVENGTYYRTTRVDGHTIFCREAGPKEAPTLLLLHGLPSSSRMPGISRWTRRQTKSRRSFEAFSRLRLGFRRSEIA